MNPGCEKKVTFLRQHDLDQVPGVETKNSFLSADVYRLPQSTNAYCTSKLFSITVQKGLSIIWSGQYRFSAVSSTSTFNTIIIVNRPAISTNHLRLYFKLPCDVLVPGYQNKNVINMRLWRAKASRELDLSFFNRGNYIGAVESKVKSETITKLLYPSNTGAQGQELRFKHFKILSPGRSHLSRR